MHLQNISVTDKLVSLVLLHEYKGKDGHVNITSHADTLTKMYSVLLHGR